MNTESKRKCTDKLSEAIDMQELKEIVDNIFNVDINSSTRKKKYVEARMAFAKILRDRGATLCAIGLFLDKDHCSILHYISNFDVFFKEYSLNKKYLICRDAFFQKRPADKLYIERHNLSKIEGKYKRFKKILDIMHERTPNGKEEVLEKKITLFLNGI